MAEKLDSESNQLMVTQKSEEFKNGQWSELPSIPLENIYSFLKRKDQVNLSVVCRNWSEGYGLPSVWKKFNFNLTKSQLSIDTCLVMKSVRKYSSMFRHVKICCLFRGDQCLFETRSRLLIEFLHILTDNSQLFSINFGGLSYCRCLLDNSTYDDVYAAIANFLESQHHLKRVVLCRYIFRLHEGIELWRKLILHNRKSLRQLDLRDFFRYDSMAEEQNSDVWQNLPTIIDFPNLTILETNYSLIFENMLSLKGQTVKNYQMLSLSKIILDYRNKMINFENLRGLTSRDWQFLKKLSPNLQVEMRIAFHSLSRKELEFLIVPHMPIVNLRYICEDLGMRMENDELFRHLLECKTNDYLVSLDLFWDFPVTGLVSHLIPFFSVCRKLKNLEMTLHYPSTNVLDLMEYWLNNRPEYLEKVFLHILLAWLDDKTFITLQNSTSEYVSRLKLIGMNVQVEFKVT